MRLVGNPKRGPLWRSGWHSFDGMRDNDYRLRARRRQGTLAKLAGRPDFINPVKSVTHVHWYVGQLPYPRRNRIFGANHARKLCVGKLSKLGQVVKHQVDGIDASLTQG